jgi:hypothetical protein
MVADVLVARDMSMSRVENTDPPLGGEKWVIISRAIEVDRDLIDGKNGEGLRVCRRRL